MKKVVIIAPTYNEAENISSFIDAITKESKTLPGYVLHIVVSDSHSSDATAEIVRQLASKNKLIHYLDVHKRGLGLGISKGLDFAVDKLKADYIITMEADLSCNPVQIKDFIGKLASHDLVVGSRYGRGGRIVNWSWWRKLLSRIANFLLMVLALSPQIHEFTNLYRGFRPQIWQKLKNKVSRYEGWLFVPAFVFEALDQNFKITEQPIVYFDRFGGRSKMKTINYTFELLKYAIHFRLKKMFNDQ